MGTYPSQPLRYTSAGWWAHQEISSHPAGLAHVLFCHAKPGWPVQPPIDVCTVAARDRTARSSASAMCGVGGLAEAEATKMQLQFSSSCKSHRARRQRAGSPPIGA